MAGYCSVDDVEALNAQQVGSAGYTTTTNPTAVQVQGFVDQVYAQINAVLASAGIIVPVTANDYLKMLNAIGAAAWAIAAAVMTGDEKGAEPRNFRMDQFKAWMVDLRNYPSLSGGTSSTGSTDIGRSDKTSGYTREDTTFTKDGEEW